MDNRRSFSLEGQWLTTVSGVDRTIPVHLPGEVVHQLGNTLGMPDPRNGLNWQQYIGFEQKTLVCSRVIEWPSWDHSEQTYLEFDAISGPTQVFLNERLLGEADRPLGGHTYRVNHLLRPGANQIELRLLPLTRLRTDEAMEAFRKGLAYDADSCEYIEVLRSPQFVGGNGFPARFVPRGPWLGMRLHRGYPSHSLDAQIVPILDNEITCRLRLCVQIPAVPDLVPADLQILSPDGDVVGETTFRHAGMHQVDIDLPRKVVQLWWPNGYGNQPLYELILTGSSGEQLLRRRFGIRQLQWSRNPGTALDLMLICNSRPISLRGANYAGTDKMLGDLCGDRCRRLLQSAHEAGINFFRYWGGQPVEHPLFYELCDQFGILVLHDLHLPNVLCREDLACRLAPQTVAETSEAIVRTVGHHTCIAAWCAGNELAGTDVENSTLASLSVVAGRVVEKLDQEHRRFFPSSYSLADGLSDGYEHYGRLIDQTQVLERGLASEPVFSMEYHSGSHHHVTVGPLNAVARRFSDLLEQWPPSSAIHLSKINGVTWSGAFVPGSFPISTDPITAAPYRSWEEMSYFTDAFNGFAISLLALNWRVRWPQHSGSACWCWNDQWPMFGAGVLDYDGCPRAAYYFLKRALAPIGLAMKIDRINRDVRDRLRGWIRVVNHSRRALEGYELTIDWIDDRLMVFLHANRDGCRVVEGRPQRYHAPASTGDRLRQCTSNQPVAPDQVEELFNFEGISYLFPLHMFVGVPECSGGLAQFPNSAEASESPDRRLFSVLISLRDQDGQLLQRHWYPFNFPWHQAAHLADLARSIRLNILPQNSSIFIHNSSQIVAPWIRLEPSNPTVLLSDNWFCLLPGESVTVTSDRPVERWGVKCLSESMEGAIE